MLIPVNFQWGVCSFFFPPPFFLVNKGGRESFDFTPLKNLYLRSDSRSGSEEFCDEVRGEKPSDQIVSLAESHPHQKLTDLGPFLAKHLIAHTHTLDKLVV